MASEANGAETEAAMQQPTRSPASVISVIKEEQEEQKLQELDVKPELPLSSSTDGINPKAEAEEVLELKREAENAPSEGTAAVSSSADTTTALEAEEGQRVPEVKQELQEATCTETGAVKEEQDDDVKEQDDVQTLELTQEEEKAEPSVRINASSRSEQNEEEAQSIEQDACVQAEAHLPEISAAEQQEQQLNEEIDEDSRLEVPEMQREFETPLSGTSGITTVSREVLAAELQCVLCHDVFVKPVTIMCGHSFCRTCLLDSLLSRSLDESECPICRAHLLDSFSQVEPVAFNINVALWNIAQMLVAADRREQLTEEDEEYSLKLDQLDAKWRIRCLQAQDVQAHNRRLIERNLGVRVESVHGSDLDDSTGFQSDARETDERQGLYPQLRVENIEDGRLKVKRNIVLDTDDQNEDGHQGMRMCFAVVEFPSIVDTFSEHQECSIAMLKMEEDEDLDTGFPFFMDENGDDDNLVISDYYNDIKLQVFDEASNLVLERIRSARRGIIEFPSLRLDVPEGVYTFRFSDETFGSFLSIKTRLGALRDVSDAPLQSDTFISLVDDEAVDEFRRDRGRGRRRRRLDSEDEHDEELSDESDDSFIVGDDEQDETEGHSEDEDVWEFHSDDEEQDEARERRQQTRRRQQAQEIATFSGDEDEGNNANQARENLNDNDQDDDNEIANEEDEDDDGADHIVSRQKRALSGRFVLDSDEDEDHEADCMEQERGPRAGDDQEVEDLSDESESTVTRTSPTRIQRIITDEDDSLDDVNSPSSLSAESEATGSNKTKREVVTASFSDDEEKESEDGSSEQLEPPPKRRRTNQVIVDEYSDDDEGIKDEDEEDEMAANLYDSRNDSQDETAFDDEDLETRDGNYRNEQQDFDGDYDDDQEDAYRDQEDEYEDEI